MRNSTATAAGSQATGNGTAEHENVIPENRNDFQADDNIDRSPHTSASDNGSSTRNTSDPVTPTATTESEPTITTTAESTASSSENSMPTNTSTGYHGINQSYETRASTQSSVSQEAAQVVYTHAYTQPHATVYESMNHGYQVPRQEVRFGPENMAYANNASGPAYGPAYMTPHMAGQRIYSYAPGYTDMTTPLVQPRPDRPVQQLPIQHWLNTPQNVQNINTIPLMTHERCMPTSVGNIDLSQQRGNGSVMHETRNSHPVDNGYHNQSHNGTLSTQALNHLTQGIRRAIGQRAFNGKETGAKLMSIDDLTFELEQFQMGQNCADEVILRNISFVFQDPALKWWKTNYQRIHTVADLKLELYRRFDMKGSSRAGIRSKIAARKQGDDESMVEYVDSLNLLMDKLPEEYDIEERIQIIRDNGTARTYDALAGRTFRDHGELMLLIQDLSARTAIDATKMRRDRKIHTAEICSGIESNSESEEDESDVTEVLIQALASRFQKNSKFKKTFKQKRPDQVKPDSKRDAMKVMEIEGQEPVICANCLRYGHRGNKCDRPQERVFCYGCDAPGVYKRDCIRCKDNKTPKN